MDINKQWKHLSVGFVLCLLARLVPLRIPNVEPLLSVQMPFAKKFGATIGFLFGALSIALYDLIVGRIGIWTLITALSYGALGVFSYLYFKQRTPSRTHFVTFAVLGTLFYDAVTGLTIGPLFFHQNFLAALSGQIPFTALHLLGSVLFALILSPAIYRYLMYERSPVPITHLITHPL